MNSSVNDDLILLEQNVNSLFFSPLKKTVIDELNITAYLLDPAENLNAFSPEQVEKIWANMPYWAFVWSSGRALARYILDHPELVKDKCIADFGAGSGIVALAALKAGAKRAVIIDIDPLAHAASKQNASLNKVILTCAFSLEEAKKKALEQGHTLDLIVVGDVLYDTRNHGLAKTLFSQQTQVIWAESQAQTKLSQYGPVAHYKAETLPNIGGFDEHKAIHIYHHGL